MWWKRSGEDKIKMNQFKPTELQTIILEILLEDPKKKWDQNDLVNETLKREQQIKQLSDVK